MNHSTSDTDREQPADNAETRINKTMNESKSRTGDVQTGELLRTVRTRRDKVLRFDGEAEDGERVTWYVAYRGKYGWSACRATGEWMDEPTDEDVESAIDVYDHVDVVDRSDTPEGVSL